MILDVLQNQLRMLTHGKSTSVQKAWDAAVDGSRRDTTGLAPHTEILIMTQLSPLMTQLKNEGWEEVLWSPWSTSCLGQCRVTSREKTLWTMSSFICKQPCCCAPEVSSQIPLQGVLIAIFRPNLKMASDFHA